MCSVNIEREAQTLTHVLLWLHEITGNVEEHVKHGVATLTVHRKYTIIAFLSTFMKLSDFKDSVRRFYSVDQIIACEGT